MNRKIFRITLCVLLTALLLAAFALDALQLAILYFYQERRIQLAYTYHGAVYYHVSACSVLEGSDISLA